MQSRKKTFKIALRAALVGSAVLGHASTSLATCSTDPYLGSVCMTAANFCPRGYLEANGQLIAVSDNPALFSLLGTTYGGDGRSSFGVPDLRSRTPVGAGEGLGLTSVRLGSKRGVETRALSLASLPAHSHEAAFRVSGYEEAAVIRCT